LGSEVKKFTMGWTCSLGGEQKMQTFCWSYRWKSYHLEDREGADEITLKWMSRETSC